MGLPLLSRVGFEITLYNLATSISLLGFRFLLFDIWLLGFFTHHLAGWE